MIIPTGQMKTLRQRKNKKLAPGYTASKQQGRLGLDPMSQVSVLHYFISRAIKMLKSHILDLKKVLLDNKSKLWCISFFHLGSTGGSDGKESTCNAGDLGLIPGLGKFPGGGNGNPLQYSCLETPMDRGAWKATVHGVLKSQDTTK